MIARPAPPIELVIAHVSSLIFIYKLPVPIGVLGAIRLLYGIGTYQQSFIVVPVRIPV
jgi:hypothetical protein